MTQKIVELLDAKIERMQGKSLIPSPGRSKGIFQIAYDQALLTIRAELLKNRGYDVTSVLGNDAAMQDLDKSQTYRLFIVGHDAPRETREEMVRWLKAKFPDAKILALNPPGHHGNLIGADFNFVLNGPEPWLAAVGSVAG